MNPTQEHWLPIPGYEGHYEVSNHGRVRSLDRKITFANGVSQWRQGKTLKPDVTRTGYHQVSLQRERKVFRWTIHRIVMLAFAGPCPDGQEVCHENGDRSDNRLANLRYDTHSNNQKDQAKHGTNPWAARTECESGHPLSGSNLAMDRGKRVCRKCRNERAVRNYRSRSDKGGWEPNYGGSCRSGHEYTPENTYIPPNGKRQCKECRKAAMRRLREKKAARR